MRVGFQPKHWCLCQQHHYTCAAWIVRGGQVTRRPTVAGVAEVAHAQGPPDYGGPLSPHAHAMSVGVGSNVLGFTSEKDVYCSKDLSLIKIDSLPASAAEFRSWKNTILTRIAAIDQTGSDAVLSWLLECFTEGLQLQDFMHSGLLPRLDMRIGSLMMDPKHLKGELGMQFKTYAESCQNAGKAPRPKF